jgi:ubiquinone/menaquinone biosynthesis C-methylase UbiE
MSHGIFHYETQRYFNKVVSYQESGLKNKYLTNYVNFVRRYVRLGSKILDLACGAGLSSHMLSKYYKVTGVDLSKPLLNYAKKHFKNIKFEVQDARKLLFKDNTFDATMACGFIEHINQVDTVLNEMLRVTRKNGYVILVSPNWFSPFRAMRGFLIPKGYETIGRNRLQMIGWLLKSLYYTTQKLIVPHYIFRNPDIFNEKLVGNDIDMVYIANQYDLKKFFEKKRCKILKINADTFAFSSIPSLATWLGVVAKKV